MPQDNITRAIKKGTGELEGVRYEEVNYEAYASHGIALLIECVTDNKNRTPRVETVETRRGAQNPSLATLNNAAEM